MTDYKLPEPAGKIAYQTRPYEPEWISSADAYEAAQMQQAYQAGVEAAKEDLTIAYMSGYHKGRDSMKAEAAKVCEYYAENSNVAKSITKSIKELK